MQDPILIEGQANDLGLPIRADIFYFSLADTVPQFFVFQAGAIDAPQDYNIAVLISDGISLSMKPGQRDCSIVGRYGRVFIGLTVATTDK